MAAPVAIFTAAISGAALAVTAFAAGVSATAERLAPYSAPLSAAQANTEVVQILGDIKRAQQLGNELSEFVRAKSDLSQTWQDLMAANLKMAMPMMVSLLKAVETYITWAMKDMPLWAIEHIIDPLFEIQNDLKNFFTGANKRYDKILPDMIKFFKNALDKDEEVGMGAVIDALLRMRQPDAPLGGGRVTDPRINIPLGMGGF